MKIDVNMNLNIENYVFLIFLKLNTQKRSVLNIHALNSCSYSTNIITSSLLTILSWEIFCSGKYTEKRLAQKINLNIFDFFQFFWMKSWVGRLAQPWAWGVVGQLAAERLGCVGWGAGRGVVMPGAGLAGRGEVVWCSGKMVVVPGAGIGT